jgi:hypothetical protein
MLTQQGGTMITAISMTRSRVTACLSTALAFVCSPGSVGAYTAGPKIFGHRQHFRQIYICTGITTAPKASRIMASRKLMLKI